MKDTMECIRDSFLSNGLYVFQCRKTNEVLYIGMAPRQLLAKRFSQHFSEEDSGGTFFSNWKECHPKKSFSDFRNILRDCSIRMIYIDKYSHVDTDENIEQAVKELESALLHELCQEQKPPKYNKEKPEYTKKLVSEECVNEILDYIKEPLAK